MRNHNVIETISRYLRPYHGTFQHGNLETWKHGNLEPWKLGNLVIAFAETITFAPAIAFPPTIAFAQVIILTVDTTFP